jgi:hypothetical protein
MKFTQAWASIASQNVALKLAIAALSICVTLLGVATVKLSLKDPLIIERACFTKRLTKSSNDHSTTEIEAFVREAITQRFDSENQPKPTLLSTEEDQLRQAEQKEFLNRGMSQHVFVNKVAINGNTISVEADRVISAGQIRSAFIFSLILNISTEARSEANPYGLLLTKITIQKPSGG